MVLIVGANEVGIDTASVVASLVAVTGSKVIDGIGDGVIAGSGKKVDGTNGGNKVNGGGGDVAGGSVHGKIKSGCGCLLRGRIVVKEQKVVSYRMSSSTRIPLSTFGIKEI